MRRVAGRVFVYVFVAAVLGVPSLAHGQATRTWVSGVGDDVNPCSRTAPCKTFAGAISKTAAGGEIDVLDPGGFGAVTITKAITIEGTPFLAGVLVSGTNGIVVSAGATDRVVIRGLDIDGLGTGLQGIRFTGGGSLHVENCTIENFLHNGISVEAAGSVFVKNTIARGNADGGILLMPASGQVKASINDSHFDDNGLGLHAQGNVLATVRDSGASGNTGAGFWGDTAPAELNLHGVVAANNDTGVRASSGAIVRLTDATVTDNTASGMLAESGGVVAPFTDNQIAGNPSGGSATMCQLGSGTEGPACPQSAICEAPVVQVGPGLGTCKHCRTKGGTTTCVNCTVMVQ